MKLILFSTLMVLLFFSVGISSATADSLDKLIIVGDKEYEFGEITKEYILSKNSHITKIQGFTTTGEMFFLRTSNNFEKIMILDLDGHWQKATLQNRSIEVVESTISAIIEKKTDVHILTEQYERVYNQAEYKLFIKTFDKSIYSGNDFDQFQGKISGAKVSSIITDPNGEAKYDFYGFVENGVFEGSVIVPENLWQKGWYTVDILIEFEGSFYYEQLTFYVYGQVAGDGGSTNIVAP